MPALLAATPASDGFHMPAEFEAHDGCYMVWPERTDTWRAGGKPAQRAFAQVAEAVASSEPVTMLVSARQWEHARAVLAPAISVVEVTTDDAWARDTGPTFVVDPLRTERRGVDWIFNAWGGLNGGLFFPWDLDDQVAAKVCELDGAHRYRAPLVLEGGAVHTDGEGTCLTTAECLLNLNRNPSLDQGQIEALLGAYLGVERILWLPRGVPGDETDGHVDNLACFVAPGRVLLTWTDAAADPLHDVCREARRLLEAAVDARGRRIEVVPIPAPSPPPMTADEAEGIDPTATAKQRRAGDGLAASYVNAYIGNSVVVFPLLDPRLDGQAAELWGRLLPDRRPIGVPAREILLGGGGIHCVTQQVPAVRRRPADGEVRGTRREARPFRQPHRAPGQLG